MKNQLVKLSCYVLALILVSQTITFAAGGTMTGSGTAGDPYLVTDYADLKAVGTTYSLGAVYRLVADIDASASATENGGNGFIPIGNSSVVFTGTFHGAGHVIRNLTIKSSGGSYIGFFGNSSGTVDNLGMLNVYVYAWNYVGGIVGYNTGTVSQCYATGSVYGGGGGAGGLVGYNDGYYTSALVSGCHANVIVSGGNSVGGLVGTTNRGTVSSSYATGPVTANSQGAGGLIGTNNVATATGCYASGSVTGTSSVGGCIGYNIFYYDRTVSGCYATGSVTASGDYVGGFVGNNFGWSVGTVNGCYSSGSVTGGGSNVGGFAGYNDHTTISGSYWNTETSGMTSGVGANNYTASVTGLTTAQMKNSSNFNGWNFSSTWSIRTDSTYPGLRVIDNAPFAFADTLSTGRTTLLSRLLLNDCDLETSHSNLTLRVLSVSLGTTDGTTTFTFPTPIARGAVSTIKYRVGEVRSTDTLWGNIASAVINFNMMDGSGTLAAPYLVENYNDLKGISTIYGLDKVYLLVADINASPSAYENSGAGFIPIGSESSHFTGTFHGRGHVVKNLYINRTSTSGVGLFGWNNGTIDSLGVTDASIKGYYHTGSVTGANYGLVNFCYATGSIVGHQFTGCLAGTNDYGGTISNCYATGSAEGGAGCLGGLIGYNIRSSTVIRCYATGPVKDSSSNGTGGLVGYNSNGGLISESYATGSVTAPGRVGGLVGWNSVSTVNTSYWNTETSGRTSGCGDNSGSFSATGLTTAQMKNSSNFGGWDFSSIWRIRTDSTYPGLRAVDNAPFAFADTSLTTGRTFLLPRLFLNDCDIETSHSSLTLHVISASLGITDSTSTLNFPEPMAKGTVSTVKYRIGEIRSADILWGNIATAIVTLDTIPPAVPQNLAIADSSSQTITIKWRKNTEVDFLRYRIYRSTSPNPTIKIDSMTSGITDTAKTFTGLVDGTRYCFRVTAVDSINNESGYSNEVNAVPADRIPPNVPQNLVITDSSMNTITIKWHRNTETDFMRYRIYMGTSPNPITKVDSMTGGIADTAKTFIGLINGTRYYFRVTAIDSVGNESEYSNEMNAIPADRIAPNTPQNLVITDSSSQTITIKWEKNTEPDFFMYKVYQGTSPNATTKVDSTVGINDTIKTLTGLVNKTRYYFRLTAIDSAGNESGYSNEMNAIPADRIAPNIPQDLVVTDSSNKSITIKWRKNTETDFMLYRIYRSTSPNPAIKVDSTIGGITDTSKTFTELVNGICYYLRITAVDSAGNESGYSNEVNAIPGDRIAPDMPQNLVITDSSSQTITVKWQKNTETDFMRYRIYMGTNPNPTVKVDSMTGGSMDTAKTFTGLVNGTRYYFRVTSIDSVGNESSYSNEVGAVPGDRIAPDSPKNLVVTDSSSQTITVKWRKNTETDFMRYRIYRSTSPNPTIKIDSMTGGITDTAKTFAGLADGTCYYFRVTAVDSAGNESGYSNEVDAVPQANIAFMDGSSYTAPNAVSNTKDNPVGRFKLTADANGATLASVRVTLSGSFSSVTYVKLCSSADSIFGGDLKLDSVAYSGSLITLNGRASAIDTAGTYYFVTVDLGVSSGNITATISNNSDITILAGKLTNTISNAPLAGNSSIITNVDKDGQLAPRIFALNQNYPNPFNPTTTITFTLAEDSYVSLKIFDITGREVITLVNAKLNAGVLHQAILNASQLSSGLYFYRLEAGKNVKVRKLMLLK